MKSLALLILSVTVVLTGCAHSSISKNVNTSASVRKYPLDCSQCDYVEDKGSRYIGGSIWNNSNKYQDLVLDIEEKDADGHIVESVYNLSLPDRSMIWPNSSVPFE